jgi:hypothetical protein
LDFLMNDTYLCIYVCELNAGNLVLSFFLLQSLVFSCFRGVYEFFLSFFFTYSITDITRYIARTKPCIKYKLSRP